MSSSNKTTFTLKVLFVSSIVLGSLLCVDAIYRKMHLISHEMPTLWYSPPLREPYQIVSVGNSHAQSGYDFRFYKAKSLDLTGVAQRFTFDLALLKQHEKQIQEDALILITISPISFSHRRADRNDGLQGNYYGKLSPFLIPDLKVSDYLQSKIVPFARSGYMLRKKYDEAVRLRIAEEQRWKEPTASTIPQPLETEPAKQIKKLNVSPEKYYSNVEAITTELASPSAVAATPYMDNMNFIFHKWYETDEFGTEYFESNRRDLEKLIAYSLQQGWRPILVTIPVTEVLADGLLDDYMQTYVYDNLAKTNTQDVPYFDFSGEKDITTNNFLFENADHLNKKGATIFSYKLLQKLIEAGHLSKELDGYDYGPLYTYLDQKQDSKNKKP